jgi:hypothetical protein
MHQTTVRFGTDLWEALEVECGRLGVSAAHFLREAAVARLAYTAGQRGDGDYEDAFVAAGIRADTTSPSDEPSAMRAELRTAQAASSEQVLASRAVSAQSELVMRRAREVRAQAEALRRQRKG